MSGEDNIHQCETGEARKARKARKPGKTGETGEARKARRLDKTRKTGERDKSKHDPRQKSSTSIGKSAALDQNPSTIQSHGSCIPACVAVSNPTEGALEILYQTREDIQTAKEFINDTLKNLGDRVDAIDERLATRQFRPD
jgi:hypothetical protein